MTNEPLITNERGQREWAWICSQVGEPAARAALDRLGNRKAYPLNVARVLGLALPADLAEAPKSRRDCSALLQQLKAGKR